MVTVFRSRVKSGDRIGLITVAILFAAGVPLFVDNFSKQAYSLSGGKSISLFPLSKYDLVHDSELIILGQVLDQYSEVPTIRNIVQVDKVIKGNYESKTIDVITEGDLSGNIIVEGPAKFQKGEKVILFLYREQGYGGEYTATGMQQGKYHVDSNGLVEGRLMATQEYWPLNSTSITDFEDNIKQILSEPKPEKLDQDLAASTGRDLVAPTDNDLSPAEINELATEEQSCSSTS